jgi:hypothetical protein
MSVYLTCCLGCGSMHRYVVDVKVLKFKPRVKHHALKMN